jgi:hypothetical protein
MKQREMPPSGRRQSNILKTTLGWLAVLSMMSGFAGLQILVQQTLRSSTASLLLVLLAVVEVVLLALVNQVF